MMVRSAEFEALIALSAKVGSDPLLVQGAGGNTSIKELGRLWIKASGLWLKNAHQGEIMVPVALDALLDALERDDPATEKAADFVIKELNPSGLRPSIETTVHALMPQTVVVHVHCVETIAHAVLSNARSVLAHKLAAFNHAVVPYARPGLPLAKAIAAEMRDGVNVLVLGNHGVAVAADTVAEAEALLMQVAAALRIAPRTAPQPDIASLQRLAVDSSYTLAPEPEIHAAASDLISCKLAAAGSLYPDHVVFLGRGSVIAGPTDTALSIEQRFAEAGLPLPPMLLFPGKGVLMLKEVSAGAVAMARCLADVTARIPEGAALRYLTDAENAELTDWDAEKYRQALNRAQGGSGVLQ